jgi:hypothetical protein
MKTFPSPSVPLPVGEGRRLLGGRFFILSILFILSNSLSASTVQLWLYNALGQPAALETVTITPTAVNLVANGFAALDGISTNLDVNGFVGLTNLVAGSYTIREGATYFTITNPAGASVYNATSLITGISIPGVNAVYTRGQSDGRYYINTGTNGSLELSDAIWPQATNYNVYSTNITVAFPANIVAGTVSNVTVTLTNSVDTNSDWTVDITPNPIGAAVTNCILFAGIVSTNQVVVSCFNCGATAISPASTKYRLTLTQWQ